MTRRQNRNSERRRIDARRCRSDGVARQPVAWYFLCPVCDAKWFAARERSICPRCGARTTTTERAVPPWLR